MLTQTELDAQIRALVADFPRHQPGTRYSWRTLISPAGLQWAARNLSGLPCSIRPKGAFQAGRAQTWVLVMEDLDEARVVTGHLRDALAAGDEWLNTLEHTVMGMPG